MCDAVGLGAVLPPDGQGPLVPSAGETSQATQKLMDEGVRRMIDSAHGEVMDFLAAHREQLDRLTSALLEAKRSTKSTPTAPPG